MSTLDATPLAARLIARKDKATAEALSGQLGLAVPVASLTALHEWGKNLARYDDEAGVALLLAFLRRAVTSADEVLFDRVKRSSTATNLLLAVRDGTRLTVGVARSYRSVRPPGAWPELENGWRPKLADNRALLLAWARKSGGSDRLVFDVTEKPRPVPADDTQTERALIAAIAASPDDDAPRHVFSDWALERGDLRGELIRLQLQRSRSHADEGRLSTLLANNWKAFAGELARWCTARSFERGFVASVSMTLAAFKKHGQRLFTTYPLRRLHLDEPRFTPALLEGLATTPALDLVGALAISQSSPAVRDHLPLAGLGEGDRFARLEQVLFSACGHSGGDWEALFAKWRAPRLRRLSFSFNRTHPALYRAVGTAPGLPALDTVIEYATHRFVPEDSPEWLEGYDTLISRGSLQHLVLQSLNGGPRAPLCFVPPKSGAKLQTLELASVSCGDEFLEALLRSPHAKTLTSLCLRGKGFSTAAAREAMKLPKLERLGFLGSWPEGEESLEAAFLAVPTSHPLRVIGLPTSGPARTSLGRFQVVNQFER